MFGEASLHHHIRDILCDSGFLQLDVKSAYGTKLIKDIAQTRDWIAMSSVET